MNGPIGEGYEVRSDAYDICKRVKEIDPDYFVFYSYRHHRYEVRVKGEGGGSVALVLPSRLTPSALVRLRETRVERMDEVLKSAEKLNEKIDRRARTDAIERAVADYGRR